LHGREEGLLEKYRIGKKINLRYKSSIQYFNPWIDSEEARNAAILHEQGNDFCFCIKKYKKYFTKSSKYPRYILAFDVELTVFGVNSMRFSAEVALPCVPDMFNKEDFIEYSINQITTNIKPDLESHQDKTAYKEKLDIVLGYVYDFISRKEIEYTEDTNI